MDHDGLAGNGNDDGNGVRNGDANEETTCAKNDRESNEEI